jgi:hypothetical protein
VVLGLFGQAAGAGLGGFGAEGVAAAFDVGSNPGLNEDYNSHGY